MQYGIDKATRYLKNEYASISTSIREHRYEHKVKNMAIPHYVLKLVTVSGQDSILIGLGTQNNGTEESNEHQSDQRFIIGLKTILGPNGRHDLSKVTIKEPLVAIKELHRNLPILSADISPLLHDTL